MLSSEAKSIPGSRWVGVTLVIAWTLFGAWVWAGAVRGGPSGISLPILLVVVALVNGAVLFALTRIGSRNVWPSLRGHWRSTLLLLVWSIAVLASWLGHMLFWGGIGWALFPQDGVLPIARPVIQWTGERLSREPVLFLASVPFLAGVFAAWWRLASPGRTSGPGSGLAVGVVAGAVAMVALVLANVGLVAVISLSLGNTL